MGESGNSGEELRAVDMDICRKIIADWMRNAVETNSYLHFDDLVLPMIDVSYQNPREWYKGVYRCLDLAGIIRNELGYDNMLIAIGISLKSCNHKLGVTFSSALQLQDEYCDEPPSIYMLNENQDAWITTPKEELTMGRFRDIPAGMLCFYSEYLTDDDPDYRRVLWLVSPPKIG